jgi:type IV pilus assembly protein PilA
MSPRLKVPYPFMPYAGHKKRPVVKTFWKKIDQKGFTLIERMIIIAIIGILAAIAIPQFTAYRIRGNNTTAKSELKSVYTLCAAYFTNAPDAAGCTVAEIATVFPPSNDVTITMINNSQTGWSATAQYTAPDRQLYTASVNGSITP